jgi:DNA replication protein DnaC
MAGSGERATAQLQVIVLIINCQGGLVAICRTVHNQVPQNSRISFQRKSTMNHRAWHLALAHRDLACFEFGDSAANKALARIQHHCEFIDKTKNIVLIGGSGAGQM